MNVGFNQFARCRRLCLLGMLVIVGGCGMDLETGYKYRPLGASSVERRGYYASDYSPEKSAAEQSQKKSFTPSLGGAAGN
jgi:hypothetical protein